jgi:hypothetical protein
LELGALLITGMVMSSVGRLRHNVITRRDRERMREIGRV